MSISRTSACADLGDAWLRYQTARIRQKHLQFGRHCRLDVDALLARAASVSRAARRAEAPDKPERVSTDHIRRAMIEAIDHCAQFETRPSVRAEALAD